MSIHDETSNKCHVCRQTVKTYHGSYHDSGWCKDMSFEEYSKPNKKMKQEDIQNLQYQNKVLRAVLDKKRVSFKSKDRSWGNYVVVSEGHEFDFKKFDYKIEEKIEDTVVVNFTIDSISRNISNGCVYIDDEIDGDWRWTTKMLDKLKIGTPNKFVLLTDSVKKALDKEGIKYDQ